jgi:hypothetical protein
MAIELFEPSAGGKRNIRYFEKRKKFIINLSDVINIFCSLKPWDLILVVFATPHYLFSSIC